MTPSAPPGFSGPLGIFLSSKIILVFHQAIASSREFKKKRKKTLNKKKLSQFFEKCCIYDMVYVSYLWAVLVFYV